MLQQGVGGVSPIWFPGGALGNLGELTGGCGFHTLVHGCL